MNRRQRIIVSVTGIFIVLLILIGLTYAYFLTRITGNGNPNSISVTTADLSLVYTDGDGDGDGIADALVTADKIMPGTTLPTKVFNVTNNGTTEVNYNVIIENVENNFKRTSDWEYTLERIGEEEPVATGTIKILRTQLLLENIKIEPDTTHTYKLTVTYTEPNQDQSIDMNKNLSFKVNIDDCKTSFVPKDVYDDSLYIRGLMINREDTYWVEMGDTSSTNVRSIVYPLTHGNMYEMKFPNELQRLRVAITDSDPRNIEAGDTLPVSNSILWVQGEPTENDRKSLIYVPQKAGEFLVVYTGWADDTPVIINEHKIILENDTAGPWYTSPKVSDIKGTSSSFGDVRWTSEEVIDNLYEPMREANPDYITKTIIGKDQSNTYNMYSYVFEPQNYEQTVFLSAGVHGNEQESYFALANFMQQVVNEDGSNEQLQYLRENVRFVVIPIINVWAVSNSYSRNNSTETNINRDYGNKTQAESKNVMNLFEQYKDKITFAIDFHCTTVTADVDLYYNFPVVAENVATNFKTINHIYHSLLNKGYVSELKQIWVPTDSISGGDVAAVNGSYATSETLQATIWNNYKIPSATVEFMTQNTNYPSEYSSEAMTLAVEQFGNFIIQNALYFDK